MVKDFNGTPRPFSFRSYNKFPVGKDEESLRHIWYSPNQARLVETIARYRLADYEVVVDVTTASETTNHGCNWDDMQYLGVGWWVGSKDNDQCQLRGFDSNYRSIKNERLEFELNAYGNSYQAARQAMGADWGHSGVDAPEPVTHPDNPTFQLTSIPLEGTPIGDYRHIRELWNP